MTHPAPRRQLIALAAVLAFTITASACGSGSDGGSEGSASKDGGATSTTAPASTTAAGDDCPAETTYTITGPDGEQEFTAASAYAYESGAYLSIYLFSEEFAEDEVASISTGFRTDDPGTIFATLHTRAATGEAPITTGEYIADSPEAQQSLEAGRWVTDVAVSLGLDQVASGFPTDPSTVVTIDAIDDDEVCGTITHPDGTATFRAVHLLSDG